MSRRTWWSIAVCTLVLAGCASVEEPDDEVAADVTPATTAPATTSPATTAPVTTAPATTPPPTVDTVVATSADDGAGVIAEDAAERDVEVDEILAELADAGFCEPDDVSGTDDVGDVTAMHFVVDAVPQPPCAGTQDDRLDAAWEQLVAIAPREYVADISLLAGYEACEGCSTVAFVSALDEGATFFLMAIDVTAAQDQPDELLLTLLHELAHVFTQEPGTQLDPTVGADDCATYFNGTGCVTGSSYIWAWIQEFWNPDEIATIVDGEADEAAGEERCAVSAAYTGAYGASSPEEDLAEVFSAYVFDVPLDPALDAKLDFFDRRPEFRRIRDRAAELGLTGLPGSFEGCG